MPVDTLTSRHPRVGVEGMLEDFVPPPHFTSVTFDSYVPDATEASQAAAVAALRAFGERISTPLAAGSCALTSSSWTTQGTPS